jgi:hypothetical protein
MMHRRFACACIAAVVAGVASATLAAAQTSTLPDGAGATVTATAQESSGRSS